MEFEYEDGTVKYYAEDEEIIHAIAEKSPEAQTR